MAHIIDGFDYDTLARPAPLPDWLRQWIKDHQRASLPPPTNGNGHGEAIHEGNRDNELFRLACAMRRQGMLAEEIHAALAVVNQRCVPPLPEETVRVKVESACRYEPEPDVPAGRIVHVNGKPGLAFPEPVRLCDIAAEPGGEWLWHGFLSRGGMTLLTALWKSGKTTFITLLLKALEQGGKFCGQAVDKGNVLYVTEEHVNLWVRRREKHGLQGDVDLLIRPLTSRPTYEVWEQFVAYLGKLCQERGKDLLIIDTISRFWPVRDENDASAVGAALSPFQAIEGRLSTLLVHHHRKGDGVEATASRGSGQFPAMADTIVEFRRYCATDKKDRRRVLTAYGRWEETPAEMVVELTDDGLFYHVHGDRKETRQNDLVTTLAGLMPPDGPGATREELMDKWPGDEQPRKQAILDALRHGSEVGIWHQEGRGVKGDAHTYWRVP